MSAVAYRFRIELRARWRAWLALALLVGAVAGTALALWAGSRRTGSAYDSFAAAQRAYDIGAVVACTKGDPPADRDEPCGHAAVGRLPAVAAATTVSSFPAFIETTDHRSIQPDPSDPCYSGPGAVMTSFDESGRFGTTINLRRFVAGRVANPAAEDEVVISSDTAHRLHIGPGRELLVRLFGGADCLDRRTKWRAPERVRVVGVQLSPGEVRPPSGQFLQSVEVTPAFVRRAGVIPDRNDYLVVRLRPGASPALLRAQARKAGYQLDVVTSQPEVAHAVENAIRPNAVSLAVLAGLTALAGLVVLGQILMRRATVDSGDDELLSSLGMRTRGRVTLGALRGATLGCAAAVVVAAATIITSPFMPIGLARQVDPDPGISVDAGVLGTGVLVVLVFVTAISAAAASRATRTRYKTARAKRSSIANIAAHAGFSPAAVSGARFALERGSGSTAVPVASSFGAFTIAVVAVVGALTFGAGLSHLRATPRLVGWNWDVVLAYPEDTNALARLGAQTRAREELAARGITDVAMGTIWAGFGQGRDLQLGPEHRAAGGFMAFDGSAPFGPSVISGRKPDAADEILLGPRTLAALRLRVGDRVDAFGQAGTWEHPGEETRTRMRIVGVGLSMMTESVGRGATMTLEGFQRLNPQATEQAWFVRFGPGTDRATAVDAFHAVFPDAPRASLVPFDFETIPAPLLNVDQIGSVPALFALIMGVMAAAVLAHVLAVAARARRRDLAILRALGFSTSQMFRAVAWQSAIYAAGALAIGLPVGVALGRLAWRVYAAGLGVVPEAVTSWSVCGAVVASALALAGVVALAPARHVVKTRPAGLLRAE